MTQPGVVPGAVLELHAARALGGLNPGVNSPLTTTWVDTAGANDGTLTNFSGSPWAGAGSVGDPYRLTFDPSTPGDYVNLPDIGAAEDKTFTYEIWAAITSAQSLLIREKGAGSAYARLFVESNGYLQGVVVDDVGGIGYLTSALQVDDGVRRQYLLVCDGANGQLYADGAAVGAAFALPAGAMTLTQSHIGDPADVLNLTGSLCVARIYPFALTATQVAQNYDAGPAWAPVVASDSIDLEVAWTASATINGGAEETYSRLVSVRFRAYSTAQTPAGASPDELAAPGDLVIHYRIRDAAGSWSAWADAPVTPFSRPVDQYATVPLVLGGDGLRTAEVQWQDDDGNTFTASDTIEVMPAGVLIGNAPPPQDVTNWRLLIGGRDFIDDCDGPPPFTLGEHGPGSLEAVLAVEDPMRKFANELVAGADVDLWDGTVHLWDGKLKPVVAVSDDDCVLALSAAGALDLAKQDESVIWTETDTDPSHWFVSERASKAYTATTDGRIKVMHEKGRGVEGNYGAGIIYWANRGREAQVIDHLEFDDSSIDVNSALWSGIVQVSDSPWGTWTTVRTWNNTTASGAVRVPTTAGQSFAEAGYSNVYAVKVALLSSTDIIAADSANNRWIELIGPHVFVGTDVELRIDELMAAVAAQMSYPTVTETIGAAQASAVWFEPTTWAAILDDLAGRHATGVEWRWSDGTFYARPKPTAPEYRHRWYVVDTRRCSWGVVTDEDSRKDYVAVTYKTKGHATYPNGTVATLYRPSTPSDPFARVGTLDITEFGAITTANAQSAGDDWLLVNAANAHRGPIGGFGGKLRTVDGQWVAASHARNGDWISALDRLDKTPLYITGVAVNDPDDVTLFVGGAEREYRFLRLSEHPRLRKTTMTIPGRRPR